MSESALEESERIQRLTARLASAHEEKEMIRQNEDLKQDLTETRAREADTWERVTRLEQEEVPRLKAELARCRERELRVG